MRRVPSLAVLCFVLVSASAASIDDPIPSQDRGDGVVADDDEESGEVEEPKAASTWDYLAEKYDADGDGENTEAEDGREELIKLLIERLLAHLEAGDEMQIEAKDAVMLLQRYVSAPDFEVIRKGRFSLPWSNYAGSPNSCKRIGN